MAILKIRDANGNVQEILAIKGKDGKDYVLTDADKQEIADLVEANISQPSVDLSDYYTRAEVGELFSNLPDIPRTVSDLPNDAGYVTQAQVMELIEANMPVNGDEESY